MNLRYRRDIAGNAHAAPAGDRLWHRQRLAIHIEPIPRGGHRRGFAPIDAGEMTVAIVDQRIAAAANSGALRLDHVQRQQGRHRRVGRATALAQDLRACLGGARIGGADHSGRKDRSG